MESELINTEVNTLSPSLLQKMDAYWRAANYLSVGQIYLYDNTLLKKPLTLEHIKPRLLGHWGTTPGLNFIYVHLNRIIQQYDLNVVYVAGPGHGGPGLVANTYLEGTYSEMYPAITQNEEGLKNCSSSFPSPGAFPATWHPKRPVPFMKAVNWVIHWSMRTEPSSTIRLCWSLVWWGMGRQKRALWQPAGTPTNS